MFLFTFLVSFLMAFLAQKLIYTNIWFNFVFGSFMRKYDLNEHVFQNRNCCGPKSDQWFFFLSLTVRQSFHRKDFKWKNIWGYGVNFWNLTKERKQPPVVILHQATFYNIFILCLSQDLIKVLSSWIFLHRYFLTILIMVKEYLYCKKILCGSFRFIWLWLLIAIMKRGAERCALQLYRTTLKAVFVLKIFKFLSWLFGHVEKTPWLER